MKLRDLLRVAAEEPLFETSLLLAGAADPADVRRQLSRWRAAGTVVQLRRGLYALAPPYRRRVPHPFVVANHLVRGSYVSRESALAHHGLIPEHVPEVTSVAARRPHRRSTPLGRFDFRHIGRDAMWGYRQEEVAPGEWAFVATPEKALLDLVHLRTRGDAPELLASLRLQNLERLDLGALAAAAERAGRPKARRAAGRIAALARAEAQEYRPE